MHRADDDSETGAHLLGDATEVIPSTLVVAWLRSGWIQADAKEEDTASTRAGRSTKTALTMML